MKVQITCSACGSSIEVKPSVQANTAQCQVCHHETEVFFNSEHEDSLLHDCPVCKIFINKKTLIARSEWFFLSLPRFSFHGLMA